MSEPFDWPRVNQDLDHSRGEFLSAMCDVDLLLDTALLVFLQVPPFRRQQLARGSLLASVGLQAKINALRYFTRASGLGDRFSSLIADLDQANTFRNTLSHASFAIQPQPDGSMRPVTMQFKRGQIQTQEITVEMIQKRRDAARDLLRQLSEVGRAFRELASGDAGLLPIEEW